MTIKILVADDHELVRIGLRTVFVGTEINVIAEASDGKSAFALTKKHRPHVALLDVRMPEANGLSCLARIKLDLPETIVLMLSGFDNPTYIARAVALGAAGYLSKDASPSQVIDAIRAAVGGDTIWSHEQLRRVSGALATPRSEKDAELPLTNRESEVLKQVALGLTNKEIAKALNISYETVKEHVQHILQKLGVSDRTQAAVWAVRKNLA